MKLTPADHKIDSGEAPSLVVVAQTEPEAEDTQAEPAVLDIYAKPAYSAELTSFLKRAKAKNFHAILDISLWGWGRIALGIAMFALFANPLTYLLAILFVSSGMGILVALSHESQHSALLRSKKWNDLVGAWLCAYPVGSVYGASKSVHLAHHKYLNTSQDPDRHFHLEDDKSTPEQFANYFLKLLCGGQLWTSIVVNGFLRKDDGVIAESAEALSTAVNRRKYPEVFNLVPVQMVVFSLLWLATGFWWAYFALWLVPIFTLGTFFGYLRGFIDHARLESDDTTLAAGRLISVPHPSLFDRALLTGLDFHFHAEHHFFPAVPHYYLPELHNVLQNDPAFRDRYLVRPTYFSFLRDYWKQIGSGARHPSR
ncbi:MAG: fatty acid desaturase [Cyanobacteria bacterium SZAS-4]|nr:fatty acid desaturase [Cyanobacteria bacterium SZAS-4]